MEGCVCVEVLVSVEVKAQNELWLHCSDGDML